VSFVNIFLDKNHFVVLQRLVLQVFTENVIGFQGFVVCAIAGRVATDWARCSFRSQYVKLSEEFIFVVKRMVCLIPH